VPIWGILEKKNQDASSKDGSRLSSIYEAAETYGARSFDNYAQIRSVAETVRDLLCRWLEKGDEPCVYLVPPEGPFQAENYQSGAFSVSGTGYLPKISIGKESPIPLQLPLDETQLTPLFERIYDHIIAFFSNSVEKYDEGDYGTSTIGFDIHRAAD